jgi:hypothetical protein
MRIIKFEICIRRIDGSDLYFERITLDDLLNRNGCLYNPKTQEVVYKREFTGLLDVNSKEIYEGDIWMDITSGMFYEVCFDIYNAQFSSRTKKDNFPKREDGYTYYSHCLRDIEVLGNIYDNPDLIK